VWVLLFREPLPDAAFWPGRRALAALDAVLWPLAWVLLVHQAPVPVGVLGPFVSAVAVLCGLQRVHRALWLNHRYRFTTWVWGRRALMLLLMGLVMKVAVSPPWQGVQAECVGLAGARQAGHHHERPVRHAVQRTRGTQARGAACR
jgi:hypothetical protein